MPLHRDGLALEKDQLDAKRKRWLTFHDQQTSGILGLLPLVKGMPVRLTATISKQLKITKHRRGVIVGWTLHADEASEIIGCERVLSHMSKDRQRQLLKSNGQEHCERVAKSSVVVVSSVHTRYTLPFLPKS